MGASKAKAGPAYHHGALRESAVRVAREQIGEHGLESLRVRKVADALGVSPPALYHHFPSKTHLIAAACGAAFEKLAGRLRAAATSDTGSAAERLRLAARAYVEFALVEKGDFDLCFGSHVSNLGLSSHACVRDPGRRAKASLRAVIAAALEERSGSLDADDAMAIFWAQIIGIAVLVRERELGPDSHVDAAVRLVEQAVEVLLRGFSG